MSKGNGLSPGLAALAVASVFAAICTCSAAQSTPAIAASSTVIVHGNTTRIPLAGQIFSRREQEFDPATNVWTVYFDPENTLPATASDGLILNFYSWHPATDPSAVAQAWVRHAGDKQVIFKFQAPDEVTKQPAYFIVSETIHADRGYGYANISKVCGLGSGAYAVTYDHKISGKNALDIELKIRSWLATTDSKNIEKEISSLAVDTDWQKSLTKTN